MLYKMAYSLASHSNHPLSVAISQKAKMFDEGVFEITEFEEIA
jgi:cation transport ATPase